MPRWVILSALAAIVGVSGISVTLRQEDGVQSQILKAEVSIQENAKRLQQMAKERGDVFPETVSDKINECSQKIGKMIKEGFTWGVADAQANALVKLMGLNGEMVQMVADVETENTNYLKDFAAADAIKWGPILDNLMTQSANTNGDIAQMLGEAGSIIEQYSAAQQFAEETIRGNDKADATLIKSTEKYAEGQIKVTTKTVDKAVKIVTKAGDKKVEKLEGKAMKLDKKVKKADKTEKMGQKAIGKLEKYQNSHDKGVARSNEYLSELAQGAERNEVGVESNEEKSEEYQSHGEDMLSDVGEKAENFIGVVEEMNTDHVKQMEDTMEVGVEKLAKVEEDGVVDAEDKALEDMEGKEATIVSTGKEADVNERSVEKETTDAEKAVEGAIDGEGEKVGEVEVDVEDVQDQVADGAKKGEAAVGAVGKEAGKALDATIKNEEMALEKQGKKFSQTETGARAEAERDEKANIGDAEYAVEAENSATQRQLKKDTSAVVEKAKESQDLALDIGTVADTQLESSSQASVTLGHVGSAVENQWENVATMAEENEKHFEKASDKLSDEMSRSNAKTSELIQNEVGAVESKLGDTASGVESQVSKSAENADAALKGAYTSASRRVSGTRLENAKLIKAGLDAVEGRITKIQEKTVPQVEAEIATAWSSAERKVDALPEVTAETADKTENHMDKLEAKLESGVEGVMSESEKRAAALAEKNIKQLDAGEARVKALAKKLNSLGADGVTAATNTLEEAEDHIKASASQFDQEKGALETGIEQGQRDYDDANSGISSGFQSWQQGNRDLSDTASAQIRDGEEKLTTEASRRADALKDQGGSLGAKVAKDVHGITQNGERMMGDMLTSTAGKMGNIQGSMVAGLLQRVEGQAEDRRAGISKDMDAERAAISGLGDARQKASQQEEETLHRLMSSADGKATDDMNNALQQGGSLISNAGADAASKVHSAEGDLASSQHELDATLGEFRSGSEAMMNAEQAKIKGLKGDMNAGKTKARAIAGELQADSASVEQAEAQKNGEFTGAMAKAGSEMAIREAQGKRDADDLLGTMQRAAYSERQALEKAKRAQSGDVASAAHKANLDTRNIQGALKPAEKTLRSFEGEVEGALFFADSIGNKATTLEDQMQRQLTAETRTFDESIAAAQLERKGQLAHVEKKHASTWNEVSGAVTMLNQLKDMLVKTVSHASDKLVLDTQQQDRHMGEVFKLEQYQEASELERVKRDLGGLNKDMSDVQSWRARTDSNTKQWRSDVQAEFKDMGEELQLADLELAQKQAEERWAAKEQMKLMQHELGADIGQLDEFSQKRLNAMTQAAGKAISDLMNDSTLDDAEKAKRIAAIKNQLRLDARKLVDQNGRLALLTQGTGRNLGAAVMDIENTVMRLATLQARKGDASPTAEESMNKVKALIAEAKERLAEHPNIDLKGADPFQQETWSLVEVGNRKSAHELIQKAKTILQSYGNRAPSKAELALADALPQQRELAEREAEAFIEQFDKKKHAIAMEEDLHAPSMVQHTSVAATALIEDAAWEKELNSMAAKRWYAHQQ